VENKSVSIIIPVYNQLKMTIDCLRDLLNTYGVEIEIIVVDDGSKEPISKAIPKLFPQVKLITNEKNLGFAKTVNKGIRNASYDLICLLNNDVRLPNPRWLSMMCESMKDYDLTAPAGGRMDGQWNYIPGEAKTNGEKFSYLVGWALLTKRKVFDKIGMIPEDFGFGYFEDVLWGYRAKKAGFKACITEETGIQHKYHATFKAEGYDLSKEYAEKRKIFLDIIRKGK
jgi:GT2 family glycosyltransferase